MSGGYNPKVSNPNLNNNIPQMRSDEFQKPFFFGGSQVPVNLGLRSSSFSGSGMCCNGGGIKDMTTRRGDIAYHTADKFIRKTYK